MEKGRRAARCESYKKNLIRAADRRNGTAMRIYSVKLYILKAHPIVDFIYSKKTIRTKWCIFIIYEVVLVYLSTKLTSTDAI